jgi:hypothetical protein
MLLKLCDCCMQVRGRECAVNGVPLSAYPACTPSNAEALLIIAAHLNAETDALAQQRLPALRTAQERRDLVSFLRRELQSKLPTASDVDAAEAADRDARGACLRARCDEGTH